MLGNSAQKSDLANHMESFQFSVSHEQEGACVGSLVQAVPPSGAYVPIEPRLVHELSLAGNEAAWSIWQATTEEFSNQLLRFWKRSVLPVEEKTFQNACVGMLLVMESRCVSKGHRVIRR